MSPFGGVLRIRTPDLRPCQLSKLVLGPAQLNTPYSVLLPRIEEDSNLWTLRSPTFQVGAIDHSATYPSYEEGEGFEPPGPLGPSAFKAAALDHSASPPVTTFCVRLAPLFLVLDDVVGRVASCPRLRLDDRVEAHASDEADQLLDVL